MVVPCRKTFFEEEVGKLKEKAVKEEKRKRRAKEDFALLLKETRRLKHDTTWEDAKAILEKEPEYKAVRLVSPASHCGVTSIVLYSRHFIIPSSI